MQQFEEREEGWRKREAADRKLCAKRIREKTDDELLGFLKDVTRFLSDIGAVPLVALHHHQRSQLLKKVTFLMEPKQKEKV